MVTPHLSCLRLLTGKNFSDFIPSLAVVLGHCFKARAQLVDVKMEFHQGIGKNISC